MEKWEEKLPPLARERLQQIKITPEDRERIKGMERLKSILTEFYQGKIDPEEIGEKLKNFRQEKDFFIKQAQLRLIDSLGLQISSPEFKKRGKAILILERLKPHGKHSLIKTEINLLGQLIKKCMEEKNRVYDELKKEVENNPELRIRKAKTESGEVLVQLSVEEAVLSSPQWKDFISRQETICGSQFTRSIEKLKKML